MTESYCVGYSSPEEFKENYSFNQKWMQDDPKACIWHFGILVLACTHVKTESLKIEKEIIVSEAEIGKILSRLGFARGQFNTLFTLPSSAE